MVVWCADWPVASFGVPPDEPAVTVYANRVVAATPAARAEGVERGNRRREAQGRCPDLVVLERDEAREARAFEPVLQVVEAFTPRIELTRPGACAFATRGPSRYFGGDLRLGRLLVDGVDEVLEPLGWVGHSHVGVADGPFAAGLAARATAASTGPVDAGWGGAGWGGAAVHDRCMVVDPGDSPAFLAPFPVAALERPALADVLVRLGVTTLGALAALPSTDLLARFGTEGERAHRLAAGLDERPPAATDPPPDLAVALELDPPAERVDAAAFVAKALADELFSRLDERALSCTRVLVVAETEHGECSERLWRHEGSLSPAAVADRVRWQLDGWLNGSAAVRPTSGISLLRLVPDEVAAATGRQLGFWGGETAAAERAARALARVQGLLGPDAARVPEWRGARSPTEQVRLVPVHAVDLTADRPAARPGWVGAPWPGRLPGPPPALVHDPPVPAEVLDGDGRLVQVGGRGLASAAPVTVALAGRRPLAVTAWAGPWPVEERWWDPTSARRRARYQVVLDGGQAHLLFVERGRWWVEASYD